MEEASEENKETIELDKDNEQDYTYEGGGIYPYPDNVDLDDIEVDLKEDKMSVFEIIRKFKQDKIVTDPEFQRNLVWTAEKKSCFIESIILNIPLPPLYFNQDTKGNLIIVDGLQRSTAINDFLNNKFALTGLKALPWLDGKYFDNLEDIRGRIEDKNLLIYLIKPNVPLPVIYDIFNRINTGGTQLQRQEIRNCIFLGASTRLLKKLSKERLFKQAIDYGIKPTRMKDRECVLRCLAFQILSYKNNYKNDMDDFLGRAMRKINKMDNSEIENIEIEFLRVMRLAKKIFGNNGFRIPTDYTRGTINIAVMESVYAFLTKQATNLINKNHEKIKQNYNKLLDDNDYLDTVKLSTSSTRRVVMRFEKAESILGEGLC